MKLCKPKFVNRFGFHTLQRIITHLANITHKTAIKLELCGGGGVEKRRCQSNGTFKVCSKPPIRPKKTTAILGRNKLQKNNFYKKNF